MEIVLLRKCQNLFSGRTSRLLCRLRQANIDTELRQLSRKRFKIRAACRMRDRYAIFFRLCLHFFFRQNDGFE